MSNLLTFAAPPRLTSAPGDQDGKSHPSGLPVRTYTYDELSTARGMCNGVLLGAAMWLGIIGVILWLK